MDKDILLIGDSHSFMVNAIVSGLKREGYDVKVTVPVVEELSRIKERPRFWILYLNEKTEDISKALVYINDAISEEELQFFVVGSDEQRIMVESVIPDAKIAHFFQRPLNVKVLADYLDESREEDEDRERLRKILIVDDDPTTIKTFSALLSEKYRVYMANSGMSAITFLAKNEVDLVLLDYEMPVASGPQILEMIRSEKSTAHLPVMMLTAKRDKESVMNVVELKPDKYLLKSMAPVDIIRSIDEFFEGM
ncbi:MAG: response regulator [Lachnospiraceae bacterium]|nr:response regulator [Lachnospiraceae bacterium]